MNHQFRMSFIGLLLLGIHLGSQFASAQAASTRSRGRITPGVVISGKSGVLFDTAIFYGQSESTADPNVGNQYRNNNAVYDIKLGYIFEPGIYVGGEYAIRNYSYTNGSDTGYASAIGLGHFWNNGFNFRAYYRFNESIGAYGDGTGYQIDLQYMTNISSDFYIGVLVSHRQTTFKSNTWINAFNEWTYRATNPAVTLGFLIR